MSYQDSPFSTMYGQDDYDIDEDNDEYLEDDRDAEEQDESDEGITNFLRIFVKKIMNKALPMYLHGQLILISRHRRGQRDRSG